MKKKVLQLSYLNILINTILALLKGIFGFLYSSVAMISDAINSLGDILTAIIIHFTIKINNLRPDANHEFGHSRAESIAGYTIGLLMILLALSIIKLSIEKLITKNYGEYSIILVYIMLITFFLKLLLLITTKIFIKRFDSPALSAIAKDHFNDILIAISVIIAILAIKYNVPYLDPIIGIFISLLILYTGLKIIIENVDELMGKVASKDFTKEIKQEILNLNFLIYNIKSQKLGNKIQLEIKIIFDKNISLVNANKKVLMIKRHLLKKYSQIINCEIIAITN